MERVEIEQKASTDRTCEVWADALGRGSSSEYSSANPTIECTGPLLRVLSPLRITGLKSRVRSGIEKEGRWEGRGGPGVEQLV